MDYKVNGRIFTVDEADIKDNMKEFDLDRDTAVRMYFEDMEIIDPKDHATITPIKSDEKPKRHYVKSDKPRKKSTRERKVDEEKKFFIDKVVEMLATTEVQNVTVKNEAEVSFADGEVQYTLKLVKHRPPKK